MIISTVIEEIAQLAAKHKVIPFLGAGVSARHLNLDWDSLAKEMADEIKTGETDNSLIAEEYVKVKGAKQFCEFLKGKLIINEFDDDKGVADLAIISLGTRLLYTTNQDNIWELCASKYGRPYKKITNLEDLGESAPGDTLFIKYHGDLEFPGSVIFTMSSYQNRIKDSSHFLNIRMRSDLLSKNFLFIGYSFRDPNIIELFEELNSAFFGKLPTSYLVAYSYSDKLEILNHKYGISIIDPMKVITDASTKDEAFEKFLSRLCEKTNAYKAGYELDELFRPSVPPSRKVVTYYEVEAVKNKISSLSLKEAMSLFRATFDATLIPEKYQEGVAQSFIELAKRCKNPSDSDDLNAAAFNFYLQPQFATRVLGAIFSTTVYRGATRGTMDFFLPQVHNVPEELRSVAVAYGVELLRDWGVKVNDSFRRHVACWIEGYRNLPDELIDYVKLQIDYAWSSHTTYEHPIRYWERVGHATAFTLKHSGAKIKEQLLSFWPKQFKKPYED